MVPQTTLPMSRSSSSKSSAGLTVFLEHVSARRSLRAVEVHAYFSAVLLTLGADRYETVER